MILQALFLSFVIMLTAVLPVYAADELWYQEYGGNGYDEFYDLVQLSDGGFALVGNLQMPSSEYTDIWLTRTNSDGDMIWNKTYAGQSWVSDLGYGLVEVSAGGYLIAGRSATGDAWMIRTDTSGIVLWNTSFALMATSIAAYCVIECNDGGFAVTGDGAFLLRLDTDGNQLWNTTFVTASADEFGWRSLRSVIEVGGDHFVLVGETDSLGAGERDVWLIRADADGNELWNRTYGGADWDVGYSVVEVSTGGFAIAAEAAPVIDEGLAWLLRVDGDGNELWNQRYRYTVGTQSSTVKIRDVVECSDGGFALTGFSTAFDIGDNDVWLGRTDSDGVLQWQKTFGGEYMDKGHALVELTAGGFAVAGFMRSAEMGPANGILVTFEDSAPPSEVPDYTLLIAIGIGGAVILIVIVVYMRKRRS